MDTHAQKNGPPNCTLCLPQNLLKMDVRPKCTTKMYKTENCKRQNLCDTELGYKFWYQTKSRTWREKLKQPTSSEWEAVVPEEKTTEWEQIRTSHIPPEGLTLRTREEHTNSRAEANTLAPHSATKKNDKNFHASLYARIYSFDYSLCYNEIFLL